MNTATNTETLSRQLEEIYNTYRTALYNRSYYGCKLKSYRQWNKVLDIALAVSSSSAIGGWLIWKNDIGALVWGGITGLTALIAIVKPIIDLPKDIERYSKLFIGHGDIYYDIKSVVSEISEHQEYTAKIKDAYKQIMIKRNALAGDDDSKQSKKLSLECYKSVNEQIPSESLWMPKSLIEE